MLTFTPVPGTIVTYLGRNMRILELSETTATLRAPNGVRLPVSVDTLQTYARPYGDPDGLPLPAPRKLKEVEPREKRAETRKSRALGLRYSDVEMDVICKGCGEGFKTFDKQRVRCSKDCRRFQDRTRYKDGLPEREVECSKCGRVFKTRCATKKFCTVFCRRKNHNDIWNARTRKMADN